MPMALCPFWGELLQSGNRQSFVSANKKNSVCSLWRTNDRQKKGTHWALPPQLGGSHKNSVSSVFEAAFPEAVQAVVGPSPNNAIVWLLSASRPRPALLGKRRTGGSPMVIQKGHLGALCTCSGSGQQIAGFLPFITPVRLRPGQTPGVAPTEGSFCYRAVSTTEVRHWPALRDPESLGTWKTKLRRNSTLAQKPSVEKDNLKSMKVSTTIARSQSHAKVKSWGQVSKDEEAFRQFILGVKW